jgi:hypothetical protein
MLKRDRIRGVRGDYDRQWIADEYFDLIVWYKAGGEIHGFQLCYDKPHWERSLTWISGRGFVHMEVDSGEQDPYANQSPILVPDGSFPSEVVIREFKRRGAALPPEIRELVLGKISEYVSSQR